MLEYVNLDVLANWVYMLRADADGAVWLANDEEEARFYQRCAHDKAKIVAAPGVALSLLDYLESQGLEGLVATVRCDQNVAGRANVFSSPLGDIASILLRAKSCDGVMSDVCGSPWLLACSKEIGEIRSRVLQIACTLGELREVCVDKKVPQDSVRPSDLINWSKLDLDWDRVRVALGDGVSADGVLDELRVRSIARDVSLERCNGMDAVRLLAAATGSFRPRGIKASREVSARELIGMFRIAFDLAELEGEPIFWQMKQWEWRNERYPLLRDWRSRDPLGIVTDQRYWRGDLEHILTILGSTETLAAFEIDLDNFKSVNDTLGHTMGDEAIRVYCSIIRKLVRGRGEVYRRGGDEVIILAPGLDPDRARALGEEIRARVELEFRHWGEREGLAVCPTASIGLVFADKRDSALQILSRLEAASRQAKRQGKTRVECPSQ